MESKIEFLNQSIVEFNGSIDESIEIIVVDIRTEYYAFFYFLVDELDTVLTELIENILHDILTDLGITKDEFGVVIDFKYKIDYSLLNNYNGFLDKVKLIENPYYIYIKKNTKYSTIHFERAKLDIEILKNNSLRVIINQASLGYLNFNEIVIFTYDDLNNHLKIKIHPSNLLLTCKVIELVKDYLTTLDAYNPMCMLPTIEYLE